MCWKDGDVLARALLKGGMSREDVLVLFEELRKQYRAMNDETSEDAVMDTMDRLAGWCSPHARLG